MEVDNSRFFTMRLPVMTLKRQQSYIILQIFNGLKD